MPTSEAEMRELRKRYNAAYTSYQNCVIALNEAALAGGPPSKTLLSNEAKAIRELTDARGKLLAALSKGEGARRAARGQRFRL